MVFGNRTILIHLVRGSLGFAALFAAVGCYDVIGWPALLMLPVVLWAFKGCPMCWTVGLFETVAAAIFKRSES
jgi:hypothetical protein